MYLKKVVSVVVIASVFSSSALSMDSDLFLDHQNPYRSVPGKEPIQILQVPKSPPSKVRPPVPVPAPEQRPAPAPAPAPASSEPSAYEIALQLARSKKISIQRESISYKEILRLGPNLTLLLRGLDQPTFESILANSLPSSEKNPYNGGRDRITPSILYSGGEATESLQFNLTPEPRSWKALCLATAAALRIQCYPDIALIYKNGTTFGVKESPDINYDTRDLTFTWNMHQSHSDPRVLRTTVLLRAFNQWFKSLPGVFEAIDSGKKLSTCLKDAFVQMGPHRVIPLKASQLTVALTNMCTEQGDLNIGQFNLGDKISSTKTILLDEAISVVHDIVENECLCKRDLTNRERTALCVAAGTFLGILKKPRKVISDLGGTFCELKGSPDIYYVKQNGLLQSRERVLKGENVLKAYDAWLEQLRSREGFVEMGPNFATFLRGQLPYVAKKTLKDLLIGGDEGRYPIGCFSIHLGHSTANLINKEERQGKLPRDFYLPPQCATALCLVMAALEGMQKPTALLKETEPGNPFAHKVIENSNAFYDTKKKMFTGHQIPFLTRDAFETAFEIWLAHLSRVTCDLTIPLIPYETIAKEWFTSHNDPYLPSREPSLNIKRTLGRCLLTCIIDTQNDPRRVALRSRSSIPSGEAIEKAVEMDMFDKFLSLLTSDEVKKPIDLPKPVASPLPIDWPRYPSNARWFAEAYRVFKEKKPNEGDMQFLIEKFHENHNLFGVFRHSPVDDI